MPGYHIRRRVEADDAALVAIENRASELFRDHGHPGVADAPIPDVAFLRAMMAGQKVWVAADGSDHPAGFAVAGPVGAYFHLKNCPSTRYTAARALARRWWRP